MQFQADVGDVTVERPTEIESTGRGAAMLAGIGAELTDEKNVAQMWRLDSTFVPSMAAGDRAARRAAWSDAVRRARSA
jgi:glycerol kinase